MNVLFLSLLYHPQDREAVMALSRDGLQNQINNYQWAFVNGLRENLSAGESLSIVNALPVGVFPTHYRKLWLRSKCREKAAFRELGSLNLPGFKQYRRAKSAQREIERWISASPDNRTILLYTLYLPYMQAVEAVKRRHPDVKAHVIVTDLPNELGISSGRTGLLKRLEYAMGRDRLKLGRCFDGFVLLTEPMAEALGVGSRPTLIMEGLIAPEADMIPEAALDVPSDARPAVLYTGTLNRELGISELLEAFRELPEAQLWLCGRGDMDAEVSQAAAQQDNIHAFGFVPQSAALALQQKAAALINPRPSSGAFTRYSFPSKTLEYMRAGKPVLCCKLEGIPSEYDEYLRYIEPQNAEGIRCTVRELLAITDEQRRQMGERARAFVLTHKNQRAQCKRLLAFLHEVQEGVQ